MHSQIYKFIKKKLNSSIFSHIFKNSLDIVVFDIVLSIFNLSFNFY